MKRFQAEVEPVETLPIDDVEPGTVRRFALAIVHDGAGDVIRVPVMVAKGNAAGPTLGLTAAVHGNEVNGIPVIQKLFRSLNPARLRGTLVGCPIMNMPAYLSSHREMDGFDINRLMPGREDGNAGQVYAFRLLERVVKRLDFLIDLHTASFGRANSLYVRADLNTEVTRRMARLQDPEIIVHNEPSDGTLRGAAADLGIPSITVEVGNPSRFEPSKIRDSLDGVRNVLADFRMLDEPSPENGPDPIECARSYWIYSQHGGLLEVFPRLVGLVKRGDRIARVSNVFGDPIAEYFAPHDGVVVGRATNPVCQTGARILHLGVTAGNPSDASSAAPGSS